MILYTTRDSRRLRIQARGQTGTGYIVEKTYHDIAPYLEAFGAYLMPQ